MLGANVLVYTDHLVTCQLSPVTEYKDQVHTARASFARQDRNTLATVLVYIRQLCILKCFASGRFLCCILQCVGLSDDPDTHWGQSWLPIF